VVEVKFTGANRLDTDAAPDFLDRVLGSAEQARKAGEQGLDLRPKQSPGVEVRE
jgi:hypothetical protein